MSRLVAAEQSADSIALAGKSQAPSAPLGIVLSFDVEEHYRIEAAAGLAVDAARKASYSVRMEASTFWLLDQLERWNLKGTFFVVGEIAGQKPGLVRAIHRAGHEVASHGWDHGRLHRMTPASFREDVRRSKEALEQLTGEAVAGYRAATFSLVRQTAWAIDVLVELGMLYDSSVYPARHDRYGVVEAPRAPFRARGSNSEILELPPATLRVLGANLPVGGGGYFRLLPLFLVELALRQIGRDCKPSVAMLYFHPWEFDPRQPRLPLARLNHFRTYVGMFRSRARLAALLARHRYVRAIDVALELDRQRCSLPSFDMMAASWGQPSRPAEGLPARGSSALDVSQARGCKGIITVPGPPARVG